MVNLPRLFGMLPSWSDTKFVSWLSCGKTYLTLWWICHEIRNVAELGQSTIESRVEYSRLGTTVTLAPQPFPFFCAALFFSIQQPCTWTKCSTLLTEMSAVTWFQEMVTQLPKLCYHQCLKSQRVCEAISDTCSHLLHSGLSTSPCLSRWHFKWQCPVDNPIIILSWFLLKLSNSPALLAEGFLRKPLAWLCPWMDCQ